MSIVVCYDGSASAKSAIAKVAAVMGSEHAVVLNVWSAPEAVHADSFGLMLRWSLTAPGGPPAGARPGLGR